MCIRDRGYAYVVDGDVYFRVSKVKEYGELSGIKIEDLVAGASERVEDKGVKEETTDFALWKKTDEGIQFDSPWSKGRPGSVSYTHLDVYKRQDIFPIKKLLK